MSVLDSWIHERTGIWPEDRRALRQYILRNFSETFDYARKNSVFYSRLYEDIADIKTHEDILNVPFITPDDIIKHGSDMLCIPQHSIERIVTVTTSGTTGNKKRIYFSKRDQEFTIDFFHHGMREVVSKGESVLINLPGRNPGGVSDLLSKGLERLKVRSIFEEGECMSTVLEQEVPCIVTSPPRLYDMARFFQTNKISSHPIKTILSSSDYLHSENRAFASRILGCEIFDHFGMTEIGYGGALECKAHLGMHIRENDILCEIVGFKDRLPVPDGGWGELAVTVFHREAMPIIRLLTGDMCRILKGRCVCGSMLKRLEHGGRIKE